MCIYAYTTLYMPVLVLSQTIVRYLYTVYIVEINVLILKDVISSDRVCESPKFPWTRKKKHTNIWWVCIVAMRALLRIDVRQWQAFWCFKLNQIRNTSIVFIIRIKTQTGLHCNLSKQKPISQNVHNYSWYSEYGQK